MAHRTEAGIPVAVHAGATPNIGLLMALSAAGPAPTS